MWNSKNRSRVMKPCEEFNRLDRHQRGRRALCTSFLPWSKGVGWLNSSDPFFLNQPSVIRLYLKGLLRCKCIILPVLLFRKCNYFLEPHILPSVFSRVVVVNVKFENKSVPRLSPFISYLLNQISVQNSLNEYSFESFDIF